MCRPQALVELPFPQDLSRTDATLAASFRPWSSVCRLQHLPARNKGWVKDPRKVPRYTNPTLLASVVLFLTNWNAATRMWVLCIKDKIGGFGAVWSGHTSSWSHQPAIKMPSLALPVSVWWSLVCWPHNLQNLILGFKIRSLDLAVCVFPICWWREISSFWIHFFSFSFLFFFFFLRQSHSTPGSSTINKSSETEILVHCEG